MGRRFFDSSTIPKGLFDQNAAPVGWFDADLLNVVPAATGGGITVTQSTPYTDADQFHAGTLNRNIIEASTYVDPDQFHTGTLTLNVIQASTYTDADQFHTGTLALNVTQASTYTDADQFHAGTLNRNIIEASTYVDPDQFHTGTLTLNVIQASTYTDADQFHTGTLALNVTQASTYTDADQFHAGTLNRNIIEASTYVDPDQFHTGSITAPQSNNSLRTLPNARGYLTAPLRQTANVMFVDEVLYDTLSTHLGWNDWTYLMIDNGYGVKEVVKVTGVLGNQGVSIERSQEYSEASSFTEANIYYVNTLEAILFGTPSQELSMTTSGGIGLFDENLLEYPILSFTHLGNTESVGDTKIILSVRHLATCCVSGQPPEIPLELLPYRVVDSGELREIDDTEIRSISG